MRIATSLSFLFCLLTVPLAGAEAAVYKYTDGSGRTVFVDGESRIPSQYRGSASQVQSAPRPAPPQAAGAPAEDGAEPATGEKAAAPEATESAEPPAMTITDKALEQRARQEAASLDRARAFQTRVVVRGNLVMVPVEIIVGGATAHLMLLLDDQAPATVLHRSAVKGLPFPPGEQTSIPGPGNRPVKGERVVAGTFDIGPFELKNFPVILTSPQGGARSFDGTLGIDFLKDHPYTVDLDREMLRWSQP